MYKLTGKLTTVMKMPSNNEVSSISFDIENVDMSVAKD